MAFGMQPLTLDLIDEGEFREELDECLAEAQKILAEHRAKYEDESHKATIEVSAKVKLVIVNAKEGTVAIKSSVDIKRPKRPESFTTAIEAEGQTGEAVLFVKAGGSDSGDPTQTKFATRDGEMVEQSTGEDEE